MTPISVFISHLVKPGTERECESVLKALAREAHVVPGYEGTIFVHPHDKEHAHFLTILRFASEEGLAQWERSEGRRSVLERLERIVQAPASLQQLSGIEIWFKPAGATSPVAPSQHRMALILFLVVYSLISALTPAVSWLLPGQPAALRLLLTVGVLVVLMTYMVLPWVTRLLSKWVHKRVPVQ